MRMYTVTLACDTPVVTYLQSLHTLTSQAISGGISVTTCRHAFMRWFAQNPLSSAGWTSASITGFGSPEDKRDVRLRLEGAGMTVFEGSEILEVYAV